MLRPGIKQTAKHQLTQVTINDFHNVTLRRAMLNLKEDGTKKWQRKQKEHQRTYGNNMVIKHGAEGREHLPEKSGKLGTQGNISPST